MKIICIDAEFTENEELLELSAFDGDGKEIYHSYYRPVEIDDWRTDIHHITPEMVAGERAFAECREEVQRLLDSAYVITGFAVDNDLRVLTRSGIAGLEDRRVLDVKDMYWLMRGREKGMSPFTVPSLLVCSNALGLEFLEADAHSASADTHATIKAFNFLYAEYSGERGLGSEEALDMLKEEIEEAKADFVEDGAKGYVKVFRMGEFYKVKYGRFKEEDNRLLLFEVEVADRYKAEYELRKLLKKKEITGKHSVYKLTGKLMDEIKKYKNEYDAEESAWCKKVVRNLGRLTL